MRAFIYTTFALVAFAFNSVLCRLALRGDEADAAGFTAVRLVSGAIGLIIISLICRSPRVGNGVSESRSEINPLEPATNRSAIPEIDLSNVTLRPSLTRGLLQHGSWLSAFWLAAYAICFSFAYLGLTAGTGALILFGSVQMSMVGFAISKGERPSALEWIGLVIAIGGLVYLVLPGLASPPLTSSLLMAAAGMSWAAYTVRGRSSNDPLAETTGNFVRSLPFTVLAAAVFLPHLHLTPRGVVLAVLSGAVTSGFGYTVWYAALKYHTSSRAAVLQLAVPVIAAAIGIAFLAETLTTTLIVASLLILGGIGLNIYASRRL